MDELHWVRQGTVDTLALRLSPGTDVRQALGAIAKREKISAGVVLGAVGSLAAVRLRFANAKTPTKLLGNHEILTLSGTLGEDGVHLHMTVANELGECRGGHLVEGCHVYTTLEVVIAVLSDLRFNRMLDPKTGYLELNITPLSESSIAST